MGIRHIGAVCLVLLAGAGAVRAGTPPVVFDFDALEQRDRARAISDYMTGVYGSTVDVNGAVAFVDGDVSSDLFIATSFQLLNRGDFIIDFADVPILGASFEGHVIDGSRGDDFIFRAFDGELERFVFSRDDGEQVFDSGWLDFGGPVDRIIVSDSGRKDVGIDDLVVQPVPEPASAALLAVGVLVLFQRRAGRG